jgi:uncharacterized protein YdbL (DUF1318 family)
MRHIFPAAIVMTVAGAALPAHADPVVQQAFAAGQIGEQADGFIGVVPGQTVDADLQRRIAERNARRREEYERLATERGVTAPVVATLTAEALINRQPAGQYYRDQMGQWQVK